MGVGISRSQASTAGIDFRRLPQAFTATVTLVWLWASAADSVSASTKNACHGKRLSFRSSAWG